MTTINALIERLLPIGSRLSTSPASPADWTSVPLWPPNVFAIAANLVERSGAYRHVIGPDAGSGVIDAFGLLDPAWRIEMEQRARAWSWGLMQDRSDPSWADVETYCRARKSFDASLMSVALKPIVDDWTSLVTTHGGLEILPKDMISGTTGGGAAKLPPWWAPALRLLVTADAACGGIGFIPRMVEEVDSTGKKEVRPGDLNWVQFSVINMVANRLKAPNAGKEDFGYLYTVTDNLFNEALAAVLPKTRTSTLGCTLRSLSHNLALVTPAGQVQARWRISGERPIEAAAIKGKAGVQRDLKLLLVPFPYRIRSSCFSGQTAAGATDWGYFHVNQNWLPAATKSGDPRSRADVLRELGSFVASLVRSAASGGQEVHGVVFPEFALDAESFEVVAEQLRKEALDTGFEFIISGTSEEPLPSGSKAKRRAGNFAAFLGLPRRAIDGDYVDQANWGLRGAREKHHRWKLNKAQLQRYALSSALDPKANWWEGIPISPRVVEFFEVRGGTSLTVLICEDLARADPCQAVVRAIGPNLVIALLMDGPQRAFRWPGHYAGVLADDPGSSVLTFTSLGLIERALATDPSQNRSVAFFKDSTGSEREIPLPADAHALLLSLEARSKEEHTLDGRGDGGSAFIWSLSEVTPVRARTECVKDWILGLD